MGAVPRHAYIKSLDMQRLRAKAGLPPGVDAAPPEEAAPIEHFVPVVMVRFDDVDPPYAVDVLQQRLFGLEATPWHQAAWSGPNFRQFFLDMSYESWPVGGRCYGWYQLGPRQDFDYDAVGDQYLKAYELIWKALELADKDIDFSQYDTDHAGPLVDSAPDGFVDTVFIVHPFIGAERTDQPGARFHSHHCSLTEMADYLVGIGKTLPGRPPFVSNDIRRDAYGNRMTDDAEPVKIDDYCLLPALYQPVNPETEPVIPIGTYCHEYGHMLGLPDLYDRVVPKDAGLSRWCLMSEGLNGHEGGEPLYPVPLSAWCRYYLRWSEPDTFGEFVRKFLEPCGDTTRVLKIPLPSRIEHWERYLLVEYRRESEEQSAWKVNWDQTLSQRLGVALWLVDESVGRQLRSGSEQCRLALRGTRQRAERREGKSAGRARGVHDQPG